MSMKILNRNMNGPGVCIYKGSKKQGYVHLQFYKCANLDDEDFVQIENANDENNTRFKIMIGNSKIAIIHEMQLIDAFSEVKNIPIKEEEEIWISTSKPKFHCVHAFETSKAK